MQRKTPQNELLERLCYWESELDIEPYAHPDPAKRLDHIIEISINDETVLMERLSDAKRELAMRAASIEALHGALEIQTKANQTLNARNKVLENRWTALRTLLGIQNRQEEQWS